MADENHATSIETSSFAMPPDVHECLMTGSDADLSKMLACPGDNSLFHGFDSLYVGSTGTQAIMNHAKYTMDCFVRLAEAIEATRIWGVEYGDPFPTARVNDGPPSIDSLFAAIDSRAGARIEIPNPFPHESGLLTSRGIATYRVPHAIYQAFRIREISKTMKRNRILEIGAGLGRTAYYAKCFGITDYTIVDLPMTNVAQSVFLALTLGTDSIWMPGDAQRDKAGRIQILPTAFYQRGNTRFDLVLNADSLTEMDRDQAVDYVNRITRDGSVFLWINLENNAFTVESICSDYQQTRHPYWLRKGYVEELFHFTPRKRLKDIIKRALYPQQ